MSAELDLKAMTFDQLDKAYREAKTTIECLHFSQMPEERSQQLRNTMRRAEAEKRLHECDQEICNRIMLEGSTR